MMGLEPTTFCMASRRSSQLSYIREAGGVYRPRAGASISEGPQAVCQGSVSVSAKRTSTPSGASARSSDLGPALQGDPLGAGVGQADQGQALGAVGVVVLAGRW